MTPPKIIEQLNKIINEHYTRRTIRNGEPRYFNRTYIESDVFDDEETLNATLTLAKAITPKPKRRTVKK